MAARHARKHKRPATPILPQRHRPVSLERDRKSTRLNSSHLVNLVCRLLLEKKTITLITSTAPNGKYEDPSLIEKTLQGPVLLVIHVYDGSDSHCIILVSVIPIDAFATERQ